MSEPFIGEVRIFGFNFAPRGWAFCNGQLIPIAQNTALFSLLGTTYGGNGQTTFALPNLQGRMPIGMGQGVGLSPRTQGEMGGTETVTLLTNQIPAHNHLLQCNSDDAASGDPSGQFPASTAQPAYAPASTPGKTMNPSVLTPVGGSQPHANMPPYLAINFCIALEGIFPSRA